MLCLLLLLLSEAEQKLSRREQAEHAPLTEHEQAPEQNLRFAEGEPKSDLVALRFC